MKKTIYILQAIVIANSLICRESNLVTVYHSIGRGGTIEQIKKHGLLSLKELLRRGLKSNVSSKDVEAMEKSLLADQYHVIYFDPVNRHNDPSNTVAITVDPNKTYCYNREFRPDNNQEGYNRSRILLAIYLSNRRKAEEMWNNREPGQVVIFNPHTSDPFYVRADDKRYSDDEKIAMHLKVRRINPLAPVIIFI